MDAIQAVIDLARENEELRTKSEKFDKIFEDMVGSHVTFRVKHTRKHKFYNCVVDSFTGEGWELIQETDDERPLGFYATINDLVTGNMWVTEDED